MKATGTHSALTNSALHRESHFLGQVRVAVLSVITSADQRKEPDESLESGEADCVQRISECRSRDSHTALKAVRPAATHAQNQAIGARAASCRNVCDSAPIRRYGIAVMPAELALSDS
jgi:hypothetical protein